MVRSVVEFAGKLSEVVSARRFVEASLDGCDREVVALLTSELATNAVVHAHSDFSVAVEVEPGHVRVSVGDNSKVVPTIGVASTVSPVGGRGLRIVDALASRWGISLLPEGKETWFEITEPAVSAYVDPSG